MENGNGSAFGVRNVDPYKYQQQQDKQAKASVNVSAIVRVTGFDPEKMTVDVQPVSKHLEDGNYQSQPPVLGVPVAATKSGGFIFRPWIKTGDIGLVVYVDHDIDKAVSDGKESEPNTERNHSTSDAVFIGGIVTGDAPVSGIPDNAAVIATDDGSVFIAVTTGGIKIKGQVEVEGDVTANGISLESHVHGGVTSGGSNTSPPQ